MHSASREIPQHRLGIVLAFGSLVWAGSFNALAKGLTPYLSPISLLLISEALAALFILLTFGLFPLFKEFMRLDRRTIATAAFVGLLNSAVAPYLWFTGLAHTSAVNASMLSSAEMLCVIACGGLLLREKVGRMQILGAVVVMAGVSFIQLSGQDVSLQWNDGDLFVVAGAMVSGFGAVLFKRYLSHIMPELAILIRNITGFAVAFVIALFFEHPFLEEVTAFPIAKVLLLLAFAFFSRYLNLTCYYEALDRLPATTLSLIHIATPLSGVLFAFLMLGEGMSSHQMLGGIFIVFGLALEQTSAHAIASLSHRSLLGLLPFPHRARRTEPIVTAVTGGTGLVPRT